MIFSIADKLENVRERIQKATISAKRLPGSVQLLAVSKTRSAEELLQTMQHGVLAFGENYVNEALEKQRALKQMCHEKGLADLYQQLVWHFIGPVQANKTRAIAEHFDWVHGIDRSKIITRLSAQRPTTLGPLNCCIQVNIDAEETKSGVSLEAIDTLAEEVNAQAGLNLRGLMCIPAAHSSDDELAQTFKTMLAAYDHLKSRYPSVDTLSMGMSGDLEIAISNGSTLVRIGTALFGERSTS